MNKKMIRFVVSGSAVVAAIVPAMVMQAALPACISGSTNNNPPGSSSSSSSSSSGTGSSSSGGGGCTTLPTDPGSTDCIIDDMVNVGTETGGYWYTYSDRTFPNTTDVVDGQAVLSTSCSGTPGTCVIATSDGMITPAEGAQFPPNPDTSMGPMINGMPMAFREFSGSGLTLWGAGMGYNWGNMVLADAAVSDAADAAPPIGVPTSFDATPHKGVAFWGKNNLTGTVNVGVHFSDQREAVAGGLCDASVLFNSPVECGDDFFKTFTFSSTWTQFHVLFADTSLHTQNYSMMGFKGGTIEADKLYQVHFQINNSAFAGAGAVAPMPPFDISVAYVTWYDGT